LSEHDRFEELASLASLGELCPEELEEFLRHKESCRRCSEILEESRSIAAGAFLAGAPPEEDPVAADELHRRVRSAIARRLPAAVTTRQPGRGHWLSVVGVAATFVLGIGLGTVVAGHGGRVSSPTATVKPVPKALLEASGSSATGASNFQEMVGDLRKEVEQAREENRALREKLSVSDRHAAELEERFEAAERESASQAQEVAQARNDLNAARGALSDAQQRIAASEVLADTLRGKLTDREARLTEVTASLEREGEMLSAGREIRDIMGARDLHIVDVVDIDGKGRTRKAFGRAFYTQGKSLIFYAFDLPAKNTTEGKFVYAAWGSNSNKMNLQTARSLGMFYNDDQAQHRWAMKFEDPKILEEIDTVFVTLEPAGRPFTSPTGKPILEAYFGTPPNHP
jgi:hypothetical protein